MPFFGVGLVAQVALLSVVRSAYLSDGGLPWRAAMQWFEYGTLPVSTHYMMMLFFTCVEPWRGGDRRVTEVIAHNSSL